MLRFFRQYYRFFACFMIMVVINMSIDAPDSIRFVNNQYVSSEDLSVNEMESISEWVLEKIFGICNAVPEYDDDDATSFSKVFIDYFFIKAEYNTNISKILVSSIAEKPLYGYSPSFWYCVTKPVLKQPPKF
jgi:hypothetical protein